MTIRSLYKYAEENNLLDKELLAVHPWSWDAAVGKMMSDKVDNELVYFEFVDAEVEQKMKDWSCATFEDDVFTESTAEITEEN